MSNPSQEHCSYLDNIFSYLLRTRDLALNLTLESLQSAKDKDYTSSISLIGVSNTDWGGDVDSRKSTVGNIFVLENSNNTSNTTVAIL
jgi:hypothetical protein